MNDFERSCVRITEKKAPTAAIIDSQSVKTADHAGARGYDAGKRVLGRKRYLLVDTLGLILLVMVHPANVQDRDGVKLLLEALVGRLGWLELIWTDIGYAGKLVDWVYRLKRHRKVSLQIVKRSDDAKAFTVLAKRWIVERTFAWLSKYRRVCKDFEADTASSAAMIQIAMSRLMLARNARYSTF